MIFFNDEFEMEINEVIYFVAVEGFSYTEDGQTYNEIDNMTVTNALGDVVDESDEHYSVIKQESFDRDYDIEVHSATHAFYEENIPVNF